MKCPKCGSELDTGFNCPKCGCKRSEEMITEYNTNLEKIYEKNTIKLVSTKSIDEISRLLYIII